MLNLLLSAGVCLLGVSKASNGESPLFVTKYLPQHFEEAQKASHVDLSSLGWTGDQAMHSGFFTLDEVLGRNTFFWYSESLDRNASAPLLLWLQGGPGASSLFGMFTEIGPVNIAPGGVVQKRLVTWNQHYHLLFLDNPVGTGYSFTESEAGFVKTHEEVGRDLHHAIAQFFQLFPGLRKNDFYVTGESYAGKWVPACAYTIFSENMKLPAEKRINLKGISIGDGAMHPAKQFQGFGDLLWHLGMADEAERDGFRRYENTMLQRLSTGDFEGAFDVFDEMLNADFYPYGSYYANVTGMQSNYFNFELSPDATPLGGDFVAWLNTEVVRAAIHVGDLSYAPNNITVEEHLKGDWMRDVVDELVPLLENMKVLIYNGQNDVILGPPLTEQFLTNLNWSGQNAYQAAAKVVWRRAAKGPGSQLPDVAGYAKQTGNLVYAIVRGAGHMVPGDQPERSLDLIDRFVSGEQFIIDSSSRASTETSEESTTVGLGNSFVV